MKIQDALIWSARLDRVKNPLEKTDLYKSLKGSQQIFDSIYRELRDLIHQGSKNCRVSEESRQISLAVERSVALNSGFSRDDFNFIIGGKENSPEKNAVGVMIDSVIAVFDSAIQTVERYKTSRAKKIISPIEIEISLEILKKRKELLEKFSQSCQIAYQKSLVDKRRKTDKLIEAIRSARNARSENLS